MTKNKGGYILKNNDRRDLRLNRDLKELGMRQLYDEETKSFSYLIWDKTTEDAIIIDPVRDQAARDLVVCTNLNLIYVVNTLVHEDFITGTNALKKKVTGLKSVISEKCGADADEKIEDGDQIHFGHRHVVAVATPSHSSGCMSFLLDDGKAIIVNGFSKLFKLQDGSVILPGHDLDDGGLKDEFMAQFFGDSMEEFVTFLKMNEANDAPLKKKDVAVDCNLKDGVTPFYVRSLRTSAKLRWGIFG